jgi:hypothetical protein
MKIGLLSVLILVSCIPLLASSPKSQGFLGLLFSDGAAPKYKDHPLDIFSNQAELVSLARREIGWGHLADIRGVICASPEIRKFTV